MIKVEDVSFFYSKEMTFRYSMELKPNKIIGLLGLNGAGKTTLIHLLLGFLKPFSGNLTLFGKPPQDALKEKLVGFSPEEPTMPFELSSTEYLDLHCVFSGDRCKKKSSEYLEKFKLTGSADKKIRTLSKGTRRKLSIVQAFVHNPKLVILDEPTSGLDPQSIVELREFLKEEKNTGKTILFSSHNLTEIWKICDELVFVKNGQIVQVLAFVEIKKASPEEKFLEYCGN